MSSSTILVIAIAAWEISLSYQFPACGVLFTAGIGSITSENYPASYDYLFDSGCSWLIQPLVSTNVVRIGIQEVCLSHSEDVLTITDETSGTVTAKLVGCPNITDVPYFWNINSGKMTVDLVTGPTMGQHVVLFKMLYAEDSSTCPSGSNRWDTSTQMGPTFTCCSGTSSTEYNKNACADVDECQDNTAGCSTDADCTNTVGNFTCQCHTGFTGDGFACTAIPKNTGTTHTSKKAMKKCTLSAAAVSKKLSHKSAKAACVLWLCKHNRFYRAAHARRCRKGRFQSKRG